MTPEPEKKSKIKIFGSIAYCPQKLGLWLEHSKKT
jgi:hypothetical protein